MKRFVKWFSIGLAAVLFLAAIVPFFVPVRMLEGLSSPNEIASADSAFLDIPFEGTDGIRLHYFEKGNENSEQTFILIHGSLFNAQTWDEVIDDFAQYGRVIAYDQAPFGLSEKLLADEGAAAAYKPGANVEQLIALMDALEIERAVLVGNSFGTVIALKAAALYPDRVEGLIMGNSAIYVEENTPSWLMNLPQMKRLGPLFARGLGQSEKFVRETWSNPELVPTDRIAKTLTHSRVENWDFALWEYLRAWKTEDLSAEIAAIDIPVLVVSGEMDHVVPIADSVRLDEELQNSALHLISDCGHVPHEECPSAYFDAVEMWLNQQKFKDPS